MKIPYSVLLLMVLVLPWFLVAQEQPLVLDDWSKSGKYLNALIAEDTLNNGWNPNRVYVLKRDGIYLWNASFRVEYPNILRIRAEEGTTGYKPTIYLYPTGTGSSPWNPPGNMVDLRGTLYLSGIMISGYYEPIDTNLNNLQGALISVPSAASGANIYIDNCILSNSNGNHIRTDGRPGVVRVTNTVFANMGFLGRSNLGAGKAIDLRNVAVDSCIVENCTFVNWQDRIIRHYQSKAEIMYLRFNHNTLVNGMSYHGMLSLGRVGKTMIITNNLLLDPFALGADTDAVRQSEMDENGEKDQFGNPRMTWILAVPNDTTVWTISNNYYGISDSGNALLQIPDAEWGPYYHNEGPPLPWHITAKLGSDSLTAFKKVNLKLNNVPQLMTKMIRWYRDPNGGHKTKDTKYFVKVDNKWIYDYDRRKLEYFHDTLDCSYRASEAPVSSDGQVVGSTQWSFLGLITDVEKNDITPREFSLEQNYPNPFNPSTEFKYSVATTGLVTIKVFDILGREVATLVNEVKQPGTYTASWNATGFASGVYFTKMQAGSFSAIKKMVLMK